MKPKWIIEHFDEQNSTHRLIEEIKRQGYEVFPVIYEPFQSGKYDILPEKDCVIVQSSINFALQITREHPKWIPGVWLTTKEYECTSYYAALGEYLFNDQYVMMPRTEILRNLDRINKWLGKDNCIFLRPNSSLKSFTGQVFDVTDFQKDWQWVEEFCDPNSLIVASTPKNIEAEWRFIAVGDEYRLQHKNVRIISGCQYKLNNQSNHSPEYPKEAQDLAELITTKYNPDPMYVIDICRGIDGKYYLLEIGAFSIAGLYACDLAPIVEAASYLALQDYKDIWG